MTKRAEKKARKQAPSTASFADTLGQLLLPMLIGVATTKESLTGWVQQFGLAALSEMFRRDAEQLAGPKGKHLPNRVNHHWGTTPVALPFGGRQITVPRPRVRTKAGKEMALPTVAHFQTVDPLAVRVVEQLLLGVSTRGYDHSLERPVVAVPSRGASKSAASRRFVAETRVRLAGFLSRRLDEVALAALMVDGVEVAGHAVVVALGITRDGTKVPLGLWQGSTENATVCTALLQDLVTRGLRVTAKILCAVDGGKGIRKALQDVFGDLAVIQRCQLHKRRNVCDHLPESCRVHVKAVMCDAYQSKTADTARKRLKALVSWLQNNGHDEAAGSLREGLEETLTVLKLQLPATLRQFFATTNAIENLMGTIRVVTRNVKRWRGPEMIRRWTALGVVAAEQRFRRIKGHQHLPALLRALDHEAAAVDAQQEVA